MHPRELPEPRKQDTDFVGGYTTFTGAYRERGERTTDDLAGEAFKNALTQAGTVGIYMYMQGETIPRGVEPQSVSIETKKDQWGSRCW